MRLTVDVGLENWTVRQLASAVDAYPAVIYHHVGDRDAVVKEVCERVLMRLPIPEAGLPWREWFGQLLLGMRPVLREYPGAARRVMLFELSVSSSAIIIERGVATLLEAGFGEESVLVYTVLMSTAFQHIAMEDDRDQQVRARFENADTFLAYRDSQEKPGLAAMAEALDETMEKPEMAAGYYGVIYEYAIARCLEGVGVRLEAVRAAETVSVEKVETEP